MIDFKTRYRQYKISQLLGVGEEFDKDDNFLKMLNHIKSSITNPDFKQFKDDKSPNLIWYGLSKNDLYIEQDLKKAIFWLDYHKIWSFFESEYGYNYQEIKELTKQVVGEHYKLKEVTTKFCDKSLLYIVGEHYKLKEVTTKQWWSFGNT